MIYAVHRYTKHTKDVGALEAFPSVERATVALQLRARKQESGTYYAADDNSEAPRPVVRFPLADLTGYLLVWRRKGGDPAPGPDDAPEELWRLTPKGGVIKEQYTDGGETYALADLTPEQRRATALRACFEMQPVTPEFTAETDGMLWRRILLDLVGQDKEMEEAVLRLVAPFMTMPPKGGPQT